MRIYAGIDEAGYGPMLGPFVVARSVFAIDDSGAPDNAPAEHAEVHADGAPPDLWRLLQRAVCRKRRDKRRRIAVDDSKKLYSPSTGLAALERGVLGFARMAGHAPGSLDELLAAVGHDAMSRTPELLWYADEAGGPALPRMWTDQQINIACDHLRRSAAPRGLSATDLSAVVIYEDRFNRLLGKLGTKGQCAWSCVAAHLRAIWQHHGEQSPWVVIDRQGGRKVYHRLLEQLFDGAAVRLLDESDDVSRYHVADGDRAMTVSFEREADSAHLPAALASMTAKYVRELLMSRFNRFWQAHEPALKPTAGYVQDARRFVRQIEPVIDRLGIDRRTLIRQR